MLSDLQICVRRMPPNKQYAEHLSKKCQDSPVRRIPKIVLGQP